MATTRGRYQLSKRIKPRTRWHVEMPSFMLSHEKEAFENGILTRLEGRPYLTTNDYDTPETITAYGRGWMYEDYVLFTTE